MDLRRHRCREVERAGDHFTSVLKVCWPRLHPYKTGTVNPV
jgi:hypothetical protein